MPSLAIQTSASISEESKQLFFQKAVKVIAHGLKKPEEYVMVSLNKNDMFLIVGDQSLPTALCNISAIGPYNEVDNKYMILELCRLLEEYFSIPQIRVFITFSDFSVR